MTLTGKNGKELKSPRSFRKMLRRIIQDTKTASRQLVEKIKKDCWISNFLDVQFDMEFDRLPHFTASGYDEAAVFDLHHPGQSVRPLMEVASGGELSRYHAGDQNRSLQNSDDIPTLIF